MLPQSGLTGTTARLPIDIRRFPWIRRLAADYVFDHARVADFFAGNPDDPAAWRDAIARTHQLDRQRDAIETHRAPSPGRDRRVKSDG